MAETRKGKMKKNTEIAERVKRLRDALGLTTQEQLAEKLGVTRPRVSEWESGKAEPTPEAYLWMGILATTSEERLWFWGQAGFGDELLRAAAEELKVDPGDVLAALLKKLPRPAETRIFVVGKDCPSSGVFAEGDTLLLEPPAEPQDPTPFWNQIVLLEFPQERQPGGSYAAQVWPRGLFMGRLRFKTYAWARPSLTYNATVGPFNDSETKWKPGDGSIPIGTWGHSGPPKEPVPGSERAKAQEELEKAGAHYQAESDRAFKVHLPPEQRGGAIIRPASLERAGQLLSQAQDRLRAAEAAAMREAEEEAKVQAPEKVRLYPEVRLIGGVIAWFAAPKERR